MAKSTEGNWPTDLGLSVERRSCTPDIIITHAIDRLQWQELFLTCQSCRVEQGGRFD